MRHTTVVLTGLWLACRLAATAAACAPAGVANAQPQTPPASQAQPAPAATAPAGEGPTEVVQNAAQGMLGDLDKDRDAYRRDPAKVGQLVDKYLLPHFDTEASARLVLGVHWRTATSERSEEHTSELQSQSNLVCRLLLEKKKNTKKRAPDTQTLTAKNSTNHS